MKIGVLSDTHGNLENTKRAMELFRLHGVSELIHCGDVGSAEVVKLLAEIPCHFVFGNTDPPGTIRRAVLDAGQTCWEYLGTLEREGKKIAFLHGHDWRTFDELLTSERFDLICTGHTHEFHWMIQGETRLLNPGALHRTMAPSVAILNLPELQIELERV
ncbi:MAG: metallophosphoesterase family protein [Thermoguttaceae bacterium]|nr:metallophosphoesterase family protein [Thermoguttaceae bacterium]